MRNSDKTLGVVGSSEVEVDGKFQVSRGSSMGRFVSGRYPVRY